MLGGGVCALGDDQAILASGVGRRSVPLALLQVPFSATLASRVYQCHLEPARL